LLIRPLQDWIKKHNLSPKIKCFLSLFRGGQGPPDLSIVRWFKKLQKFHHSPYLKKQKMIGTFSPFYLTNFQDIK